MLKNGTLLNLNAYGVPAINETRKYLFVFNQFIYDYPYFKETHLSLCFLFSNFHSRLNIWKIKHSQSGTRCKFSKISQSLFLAALASLSSTSSSTPFTIEKNHGLSELLVDTFFVRNSVMISWMFTERAMIIFGSFHDGRLSAEPRFFSVIENACAIIHLTSSCCIWIHLRCNGSRHF